VSCTHVKMASDTGFILRTLFILLISCLVKATWNTKDYLKREHTITKPYTGKMLRYDLTFVQVQRKS
jgi:hypothetical protein